MQTILVWANFPNHFHCDTGLYIFKMILSPF